jgi:hypothetical protein
VGTAAALAIIAFLLVPLPSASANGSPLCEYWVHHPFPWQTDPDAHQFSYLNRIDVDTRNCTGVLALTIPLSPDNSQSIRLAVLPGTVASTGRGQLAKLGLWKIGIYGYQGQPYDGFTDPCKTPGFIPNYVLGPRGKIKPFTCP